jgi:hypothetical protein
MPATLATRACSMRPGPKPDQFDAWLCRLAIDEPALMKKRSALIHLSTSALGFRRGYPVECRPTSVSPVHVPSTKC